MARFTTDYKRREVAEKKWLDTYQPPGKIDGRYIVPMPDYVYAPAGGLEKIGQQLLEDDA